MGELGSIPASGRFPGERNGSILYQGSSILAWRVTWIEEPVKLIVCGVAELNTTEQLTLLLQNLKNILFNLKNQGKKKKDLRKICHHLGVTEYLQSLILI